jgi:transposase-like protein
MPDNSHTSGSPLTRKKYTPAFKAECVRQVAAGARQTDVARAQGLSAAGSARRWLQPCPVVRSAKRLGACA